MVGTRTEIQIPHGQQMMFAATEMAMRPELNRLQWEGPVASSVREEHPQGSAPEVYERELLFTAGERQRTIGVECSAGRGGETRDLAAPLRSW
jgi:hypothetical protein